MYRRVNIFIDRYTLLKVKTFNCKCVPKNAITLTSPTVGLQSANLLADEMTDFSSFFISRQKINYNYLVIIFFHRQTVLGFWQSADHDWPMVGRRSADKSADVIFE